MNERILRAFVFGLPIVLLVITIFSLPTDELLEMAAIFLLLSLFAAWFYSWCYMMAKALHEYLNSGE